jgi:asparagine synthase (glutamine-hydrolysing)
MCGIAGILHGDGAPVAEGVLRAMAGALAHRGPDDEGFHQDGPLGLAHRRLSILDLTAAGHQPMSNEDGTVWLVYNGQLYGFEPQREWLRGRGHRFRSRTDTEILVHLYEEKGDAFVQDLDGMFAFALWDSRRRRLLLGRDRFGIKPLYYVRAGQTLAFASEARALLAVPEVSARVDPRALVHYLYQSSVPGGISTLEGLRQVRPAHTVSIEDGVLRETRYWSVPREETDAPTFGEAVDVLGARLRDAVRSHLVADVAVGTFLSGGLDSAAVTLQAQRAIDGPLHTFSARFDSPGHDEGGAALESAQVLGTIHHELHLGPDALDRLPAMVEAMDEPFAVSSIIALYHLSRFAREHVKVVLTGDGADEILGGYPWRHEPDWGRSAGTRARLRGLAMSTVRSGRGARAIGPGLAAQMAGRLGRLRHPDQRYAEIVCAFTPEEMRELLVPEVASWAQSAWAESPLRRAYLEEDGPDDVNRRLRADLRTTLVDEMLVKVDRTTMAAGLEARVPFLDRAFVEWAMSLPGSYKVRQGVGKVVLRYALAPDLPAAALRPKHGFNVPLGDWLRGRGRALVGDTLSPATLRRRGLLRPEAVTRLVEAHLAGRGDYSRKLFTLLVLELWLAARGQAAALVPPAALAAAVPARA